MEAGPEQDKKNIGNMDGKLLWQKKLNSKIH